MIKLSFVLFKPNEWEESFVVAGNLLSLSGDTTMKELISNDSSIVVRR